MDNRSGSADVIVGIILAITLFWLSAPDVYAGRIEKKDIDGNVFIVWTADFPQYDRKAKDKKKEYRRYQEAMEKYETNAALCGQIPDDLDRSDCMTGKGFHGSGYDFQSMRYGVREACGNALNGEKSFMVKCIVAAERTGQQVVSSYTSIKSILSASGGCDKFIERLGAAYNQFFAAEAIYEGTTGQGWGATKSKVCPAYAELMAERGLDSSWSACGTGTGRPEQLAWCSGDPQSAVFIDLWRRALSECETGKPLGIVDQLRSAVTMAGSGLDANIDCDDVKSVSTEYKIASPTDIQRATEADRSARGERSPRDAELQRAVIDTIERQTSCSIQRGEWCQLRSNRSVSEAVAEAATSTVLRSAFETIEAAGIPNTQGNSISAKPSIFIRFDDLDLENCQKVGNGQFECRYNLAISCEVKGHIQFQGADIFGGELTARICPPLTQPLNRVGRFDWRSNDVILQGGVFR